MDTATLILLILSGVANTEGTITQMNPPVIETVEFQSLELCRAAERTYQMQNSASAGQPGHPIIQVHATCVETGATPASAEAPALQ